MSHFKTIAIHIHLFTESYIHKCNTFMICVAHEEKMSNQNLRLDFRSLCSLSGNPKGRQA